MLNRKLNIITLEFRVDYFTGKGGPRVSGLPFYGDSRTEIESCVHFKLWLAGWQSFITSSCEFELVIVYDTFVVRDDTMPRLRVDLGVRVYLVKLHSKALIRVIISSSYFMVDVELRTDHFIMKTERASCLLESVWTFSCELNHLIIIAESWAHIIN